MSKLLWLRVLAPVVGRLPGVFYPIAWVVGWGAWKIRTGSRETVIRNLLPLCDGDRERAERESLRVYRNVARYWVDLTTVPHREMVHFERDHLRIVNPERLAVLDEPGPIVAVSAHTGNVELAIQALTYRGRPFVALVERLEPPALMRYMLRMRSAAGAQFYEPNFRGLRACVEALRNGEIVGVMGDRDIQGTGICTSLAGREVRLPSGPWALARRTSAMVLPVFSHRIDGDDFRVFVDEPFRVASTGDEEDDVREAVERWATVLENHLKRDPAQWTVMEDFWRVHACGEG
jgi:KDO2-lipid IV(A) lauroyltransferase